MSIGRSTPARRESRTLTLGAAGVAVVVFAVWAAGFRRQPVAAVDSPEPRDMAREQRAGAPSAGAGAALNEDEHEARAAVVDPEPASPPPDPEPEDWKAPFREKYAGLRVEELKRAYLDLQTLARLMRRQIRDSHIASGRCMTLPQGQTPEPHQIPLPMDPQMPLQRMRVSFQDGDGDTLVHWVYLDPAEHPNLVELQREYAFLATEVKLMGDHVMFDSEGNLHAGW